MLHAKIERTDNELKNIGLTPDEIIALRCVANGCAAADTLDEAQANLRTLLPGGFVYRGGSHVSLYWHDGGPRLLFIHEHLGYRLRTADGTYAYLTDRQRPLSWGTTADVTKAHEFSTQDEVQAAQRSILAATGLRTVPQLVRPD